jgi:hypothetical protein
MYSKFMGQNGPDGKKILEEGGKILTGDPDKQSGGKYNILGWKSRIAVAQHDFIEEAIG